MSELPVLWISVWTRAKLGHVHTWGQGHLMSLEKLSDTERYGLKSEPELKVLDPLPANNICTVWLFPLSLGSTAR